MCCNEEEVAKKESKSKPNLEESKLKVLQSIDSFISNQTSTYNINGIFNPNLNIPIVEGFKGKYYFKKYYVIISYTNDNIRYMGIVYLIKNNKNITVTSAKLSCSSSIALPLMDNITQISEINFNSNYKKL